MARGQPFADDAEWGRWQQCVIGCLKIPLPYALGVVFCLGGTAQTAVAQGLCPAPAAAPPFSGESLQLWADQLEFHRQGRSVLRGQVELSHGWQRLRTSELYYESGLKRFETPGSVEYQDQHLSVRGARGFLDWEEQKTILEEVEYSLVGRQGHGSAARLEHADVTRLQRMKYTTCPQGAEFWRLSADKMKLNHEAGLGTAWDATLRVGGVPLLFWPVFSFPIDDRRRSGLLFPEAGFSSRNGAELELPYYWNLAPNRDATLTLRTLSRRGGMLLGEYRHLSRRGMGRLHWEVLPVDRAKQDRFRALIDLRLRRQWSPFTSLRADYRRVSERSYLTDLGNRLESGTDERFLEQRVELRYQRGPWQALLRAQGHQALDADTDQRQVLYRRLPQLSVRVAASPRNRTLGYELDTELVQFDHGSEVDGLRLDLQPALSWPWHIPAGFFEPRVGFRYTTYRLRGRDAGTDSSPHRLLPFLHLDGGLFFDRGLRLRGRPYLQTLEPRLHYRYVPYRDQSDLPLFDSHVVDLTAASLFYTDRFTGADRMGDANQLAAGIHSRLFGSDGRERGSVQVGQIYFFRDRRVQLPATAVQDRSSSPLLQSVSLQLPRNWYLEQALHWNVQRGTSEKLGLYLQYRPEADRLLNVGYRRRTAVDVEQSDLSGRWRLGPRWALLGRWNQAFAQGNARGVLLELLGGVEYRSCCWSLRLLGRRFLSGEDRQHTSGVFLQLELLGLTGVGRQAESVLTRSIRGYEER